MNCKICKKYIEKAAGEVRSFFVDGYEVIIKIRRHSPGDGNTCEECSRTLVRKALEINELEKLTNGDLMQMHIETEPKDIEREKNK